MSRKLGIILFIALSLGGGLFIGATNIPGEWYEALAKPPGTPPGWLFGPVWTVLYVLIGVAGARVWRYERGASPTFGFWAAQMGLNFIWSPIVFTGHGLALGLTVILALLAVILIFIRLNWKRDRAAALLFFPYAAWVGYASYLNAGLFLLN